MIKAGLYLDEEILFFDKMPDAFPLYEAVRNMISSECEGANVKVQKTQIAFFNKHNFAFVWLPIRKMAVRPNVYIILTFGLNHRLDSSRIMESTEPYPERWTHHVLIQRADEIDDQITAWVKEASHFSMYKRRKSKGDSCIIVHGHYYTTTLP